MDISVHLVDLIYGNSFIIWLMYKSYCTNNKLLYKYKQADTIKPYFKNFLQI